MPLNLDARLNVHPTVRHIDAAGPSGYDTHLIFLESHDFSLHFFAQLR